MPTITLSKKELLKSLGKKLSDEKLAERIAMMGTDLEGIEGDEIHVEIFPNRPDLLSQQGFGRALASFLDIPGKTGLRKYETKSSGVKVIVDKSVEKCRPYTSCAVVRGLKLNDERIQEIVMIQEKLHVTFGRNRKKLAIGIYPMEHVKPPIHFKGLAPEKITFIPLEARGPMTAKEILEDHPKGKEYAHLVDGLKKYACFIDDAGEYMSFTPIINSEQTGKVTEKTTDVFIECSGFDFRVLQQCTNMIVTALADMGGRIESCKLVYEHGTLGTVTAPDLNPRKKRIDRAYINKILGLDLDEKALKHCLEKMGYGYDTGKKEVLVPAYRADILHQVDFAEDIAIAYGYENFEPEIPSVGTVGEEAWSSKIDRKVREILVGHGLLEMKNYHLANREHQLLFTEEKNLVRLKNCVSLEYDTMRIHPVVSLIAALARNRHHELPHHVFEIGHGVQKAAVPVETRYVAAVLADEEAGYTEIRQLVDSICASMQWEVSFAETDIQWLFPGRTAAIMHGKKAVGYVGEVHPHVLESFGLEVPCSALLLNLDAFN